MPRIVLLVIVAAPLFFGACGDKRKPIARGDAGPSVVMLDHAPDPQGPVAAPEAEPNDTIKQAMAIDPDVPIAGVIKAPTAPEGLDDLDCFALRGPPSPPDLGVDTDAGGAPVTVGFVTVRATREPLLLELLDSRGKPALSRVVAAGERGYLSYVRLDPVVGAVVRVRRSVNKKAQPVTSIDYTIEYTTRLATADEEIEPNDGTRAMALPASGVLIGRLDGVEDRDLVSLPGLAGGATYRVEISGVAELSLELRLRSGTTTLMTSRGAKGGELRLRNLPGTASGPLVLQVRSVDGASELPYNLRISSEPPLDAVMEIEPNDDRSHANAVKPGDVLSGYLWPGDVDWFCAPGDVGIGARIDGLAEVDWKIELADNTGKMVRKVDEQKRGGAENAAPDPLARCVRLSARSYDTAFDAPYRLEILPGR